MILKRNSCLFIAAAAAMTFAISPAIAGPGGPGCPGDPGGSGPPPPPTITALSVAILDGAFTLTQPSAPTTANFVTTAKYTATGVTITVTTSDATPVVTTYTGDVTINTSTTADATGNGVVCGDLTFVATDKTVLAAKLEGLVGTVTGPLLAEGTLGIPPAKPATGTPPATAPAAPAQVAATLTTDSSLNATLKGYVATATISAPTPKTPGGTKSKPKTTKK